jgi:hypothetical protein
MGAGFRVMRISKKEPKMKTAASWRFRTGVTLIAIGWICPLFIPLVTNSTLTTEWKTALSGFLLVVGPEVLSLLAIAILGKDGFNYLKEKVFAVLRRAAPSAKVSRTRYRAGLAIWALLVVYGWLVSYAPDLVPGYSENRIALNFAADFLFVVSLFVLGGDFWEKFRALFTYDS